MVGYRSRVGLILAAAATAVAIACGGNGDSKPTPTYERPTTTATVYPTNTPAPTAIPATDTPMPPTNTPDPYISCKDRRNDYSITIFGGGNWLVEVPAEGHNKYRGSGLNLSGQLQEISNELSQYGIPGVPAEGSVIVERFDNSTRLSYVPRFGEVIQNPIEDLSNDGPTVRYTRNVTNCDLV